MRAPQQEPSLTADEILANAIKLAGRVRTRNLTAEYAALRMLPGDIVQDIRTAGIRRMQMPRSWGGPEMTIMQSARVIEELAKADGSIAWCSFIWSDSGVYPASLDDKVARSVYPRLEMATSGWVYPVGTAKRVAGGYEISGQWMFGSGINHCDWVVSGCMVDDVVSDDPIDRCRIMFALPGEYEILDTWYTSGLCGTGSTDYRCDRIFIPDERIGTFFQGSNREGPLWRSPGVFIAKAAGMPLGIASDALTQTRRLMETKTDRIFGPYRNMTRVQSALAEAQAMLGSARSYLYGSLETQWVKLEARRPLTVEERADVWLARTNAFQVGRKIVSDLCDLIGGTSVYTNRSPLDRHLRDVQTACQHVMAQTKAWEWVGQLMLGVGQGHPFL